MASKSPNQFITMMVKKGDMKNYAEKYIEALEEEQKKIQVFQRELPLCFDLITQAIESCRKELSEQIHGQSECNSDRTTSECGGGAVFEEFMPIKLSSSSSIETNIVDEKKSDWLSLRSVQSPDPQSKEDQVTKTTTTVVELKLSGGAFHPFQKEKAVADSEPLKAVISPTTSSTAESGGGRRESEQHRKQRRCWSPELHRRFLHALHQLGGSHVATPKQIRDLMKVDGLTNDEVKSHLQKYRLHTRRPATPVMTNGGENQQPPQFMVVEGIWVPTSKEAANSNNRVYAPVAVQATGERSSRRCKSPATSSSTHTPHLLPLS